MEPTITEYQARVYALLKQIPSGKVSTYAAMSRALSSSPRAVGGALRRNPFAPEIPCHRVISADGYVGGFKGEWHKAPSGINTEKKLELLKGEGVVFDDKGKLVDQSRLWAVMARSRITDPIKVARKARSCQEIQAQDCRRSSSCIAWSSFSVMSQQAGKSRAIYLAWASGNGLALEQ